MDVRPSNNTKVEYLVTCAEDVKLALNESLRDSQYVDYGATDVGCSANQIGRNRKVACVQCLRLAAQIHQRGGS